jgi:hypothetical protein
MSIQSSSKYLDPVFVLFAVNSVEEKLKNRNEETKSVRPLGQRNEEYDENAVTNN